MGLKQRLLALIFLDSAIVIFSIFICNFILAADIRPVDNVLVTSSLFLLIVHHICAYYFKLYKKAWEYASANEIKSIVYAVTISVLTTGLMQVLVFQEFYVRTLIMTWMAHIILIGGSRMAWRLYRDTYISNNKDGNKTLIVGAGAAGVMVARQLKQETSSGLLPVVFLDDNPSKQGLEIMDLPVYGGIKDVKKAVEQFSIEHIIIAVPSLESEELNQIVNVCAETKVRTQTLPRMEDIMLGKVEVTQFKDVDVEDLLGREPVKLDVEGIADSISNKRVLVTGAGGSIGSEICRQIARFSPEEIILLGHGENSIYSIEIELRNSLPELSISTEIADIQDKNKMLQIFESSKPHVVFHAAAHKHVPLMERNPEEAVKNNTIGTKNTAEASDRAGVNTFVMVSSDKAVNPTSVMGATKRLAEMIVQHMDTVSRTKFVAVRFGNVLGSRGSVIPLFKKQIQNGGPVTVTDPEMIRYFMTIPEASRLVIQAGALAKGGEIFVLDMGEPVKIVDLAKNLIKLSGYTVDEIGIKFSGIRPGEKMYEELLSKDEVHEDQIYPKIYVGKSSEINIDEVVNFTKKCEILEKSEITKHVLEIARGESEEREHFSAVNKKINANN
ncbi:NDP-sugar epimerase, includes UDP-GlcNAc-inverting 4,6-dehydratase FlaA1 and capsular polysaccharide biosynthesis protein EpsC [Marinococcus luteus]|uniref:NDP-sugar epimerase, includes UDP-GlcNAc-inverting 4,6-dehydratase FlaA1 and capsular polysaccharide biosynthesis protein EpsC n=1 Tax=Marinococcus luteus TaxID=1122204 RepID=A0A1H2TIB0_9BACI|nr:nucleoside-diphosphate sugar epimerase/dehydratase [Marinococcus luteus]SDW42969.1 NDP-sugar epimerase, includes UDP-GlcNAc-inverting 4,6-dehydratase FlaA1 and capsular polysaccharide biosynthesis protein EpsC [Marinococcus luteus]